MKMVTDCFRTEEARRQALLEHEDRRRARNYKLAMYRIQEDLEQREQHYREAIAEARNRGACTNPKCLWPGYRLPGYQQTKYVKHRNRCPRGA